METRQLGKTDMTVSVLGFGGAEIGFEKVSPELVVQILDDALDAGLNVIDTAECYLRSEEMIGQAMSRRRKDFYLFTKCGHPDGPRLGGYVEDWRPSSLLTSIERSLQRLKTDCVDLVQLHSCSEDELHKGDVIAALQTARQKGYTRYIGYSGDDRAARYAVECGAFDTLQTSLSIADQQAIDLTLPLARERQIGVIVKRPIANAAWKYTAKPENAYHQTYWERLQKLDYDVVPGDLSQAVSTALRFTLGVPGVHTAIVGTTKVGRWRENAALLNTGPLSTDRFAAIRTRWRQIADPSWIGQT
jgi:aryl-alcohol dehydrogenase-like predicted oxidoreductase